MNCFFYGHCMYTISASHVAIVIQSFTRCLIVLLPIKNHQRESS